MLNTLPDVSGAEFGTGEGGILAMQPLCSPRSPKPAPLPTQRREYMIPESFQLSRWELVGLIGH